MLFITGDTHRKWKERFSEKAFPIQKSLTKNDYVIVCGDFGIWDGSEEEEALLDWVEERPFTVLFVSGNHSNYDLLDEYPVEEWKGGKVNFIRPSVIHLRRGQVFDIDGHTFFAFGGASCHDIQDGILEIDDPRIMKWYKKRKMFRINHYSWWEQELPNEEEMEEGRKNLEKHDYKVDFVITHCPTNDIIDMMDPKGQHPDYYKKDILTDYLQELDEKLEYAGWFFGHFHRNQQFTEDKICLYETIVALDFDVKDIDEK